MPLTSAEKQKRYREKKKSEGKYDEYKQRHRENNKNYRDRQKEAVNKLPANQKKQAEKEARENVRLRVAKHRRLKKANQLQDQQGQQPFNSAMALAKATARARRGLPQTPRRRSAVCRRLYVTECGTSEPTDLPKQGRTNPSALSDEIKDTVLSFYQRDDISRLMPGRKDAITMRDKDGTKIRDNAGAICKVQIRHLTLSLAEAHALFTTDHPNMKIGKSKFAELRPQNVYLSNKMPHNVCTCRYHDNFINAIDALHKACPDFPAYSYSLPESFLCKPAQRKCWLNECSDCSNGTGFRNFYEIPKESALVTWIVWENVDDRLVKVMKEGLTVDLVDYIVNLIPQFLEHCFVKREQSCAYNAERELATSEGHDPTKAVLQVDYSENYTCVSQDEIQNAHWHQSQVSLFTAALWHSGSLHSIVIASDNLTHSKDTLVAYIDRLLEDLPETVKMVSLWSDGPSSQFKNKYVAASLPALENKHGITITWNYFATSHGKGPVDGIGGALKRHVWKKVLTRQNNVYTAAQLTTTASDMQGVKVIHMSDVDIAKRNQHLNLVSAWEKAETIPGITKVHCLQIQVEDTQPTVQVFQLSKDRPKPEGPIMGTNVADPPINVGDWYVVEYNEELFPGEVTEVCREDFRVSVMKPAGPNTWKWPAKADMIYYPKSKMIKKLGRPEVFNSRGHFKFDEQFQN